MNNARAWWHNLEVVESLRAPLQELEPLPISIELNHLIGFGSVWRAEHIGLHRVVNDQVDRAQWINLRRIAAKSMHSVSHGGQVNDGWHTGEVL